MRVWSSVGGKLPASKDICASAACKSVQYVSSQKHRIPTGFTSQGVENISGRCCAFRNEGRKCSLVCLNDLVFLNGTGVVYIAVFGKVIKEISSKTRSLNTNNQVGGAIIMSPPSLNNVWLYHSKSPRTSICRKKPAPNELLAYYKKYEKNPPSKRCAWYSFLMA